MCRKLLQMTLFITGCLFLYANSAGAENQRTNSAASAAMASKRDEAIEDGVRRALQELSALDSIETRVENATVTLKGRVDSLKLKNRIVEAVEKINGVRLVKTQIDVQPVARSDADIRRDLENAITQDAVVDRADVATAVTNGFVTLTGKVDSFQEKRLAGRLAEAIAGIRGLRNELQIVSPARRSDSEIIAEVTNLLRSDAYLKQRGITVNVNKARVNLEGVVGSVFEFARATSDAWVPGVAAVDAGNLKISGDQRTSDAATAPFIGEAAGAKVPKGPVISEAKPDSPVALKPSVDEEIQETVAVELTNDARLTPPFPKVSVKDGVVTLKGTVTNLRAKWAAEEVARLTVGVRAVYNNLKVEPTKRISDTELAERVQRALQLDADFQHSQIGVRAKNGIIYLSGKVNSAAARTEAGKIAAQINGVVDIHNELKPGS